MLGSLKFRCDLYGADAATAWVHLGTASMRCIRKAIEWIIDWDTVHEQWERSANATNAKGSVGAPWSDVVVRTDEMKMGALSICTQRHVASSPMSGPALTAGPVRAESTIGLG